MRVLILSKAAVVGQYQTKLTALAQQPGLELVVVSPPAWRDERGQIPLEKQHTGGYRLLDTPIRFNGHFHLHYYPAFEPIVAQVQPDIVHIDEEPYNLATFLAAQHTRRTAPRARILFFTWQNIPKRYPPPFSWMERSVYRLADAAIAGNREGAAILQSKGFAKPIRVIPQFGVPAAFVPAAVPHHSGCTVIGYAGRLVEEKGIGVLVRALAQVHGNWELQILGSGPERSALERQAHSLGIAENVHFMPWTASDEMPRFYQALDLLVVPSLTRPNWKEQFGRVLIEAMATGVAVIGSDSGEIPNVIGDAGIIVPEGDVSALARAIQTLLDAPQERARLASAGRARVSSLFSEAHIVADTLALYRSLASAS